MPRINFQNLAVLYCAMPGATGLKILATVKNQDGTTPVLMMTVLVHLGLLDWEALGAIATLQKPFKIKEVSALIRRIEREV